MLFTILIILLAINEKKKSNSRGHVALEEHAVSALCLYSLFSLNISGAALQSSKHIGNKQPEVYEYLKITLVK